MRRPVAVALAVAALGACGGYDDRGGPTSSSTGRPPVTDPAPAGPETMSSVPPAGPSTTSTTAAAASGEPPATGDPELDALARRCHDGAMEACDELFAVADFGSEAEEYGASCGGRLPGNVDYCVDALGD